jgi:hypothetical protein
MSTTQQVVAPVSNCSNHASDRKMSLELSVKTVPGTPGEDSPVSLQGSTSFGWAKLINSPVIARTPLPLIGTLSAVGAICVQKLLSNFLGMNVPSPLRATISSLSSTTRTFSGLPSSDDDLGVCCCSQFNNHTNLVQSEAPGTLNDGNDNDNDADAAEFAQKEASLLVEVARAQRVICRLELELHEARLNKHQILRQVHTCQAVEAQRKLEVVEFDLGYAHNSMRKNGIGMDNYLPNRKRRCMNSGGLNFVNSMY